MFEQRMTVLLACQKKINRAQFSTWNNLLLTLPFNQAFSIQNTQVDWPVVYNRWHQTCKKSADQKVPVKFIFPTIKALKRGSENNVKSKICLLNPNMKTMESFALVEDSNLRSVTKKKKKFPILQHAKNFSRLYLEQAYNICNHQGTEPKKRW